MFALLLWDHIFISIPIHRPILLYFSIPASQPLHPKTQVFISVVPNKQNRWKNDSTKLQLLQLSTEVLNVCWRCANLWQLIVWPTDTLRHSFVTSQPMPGSTSLTGSYHHTASWSYQSTVFILVGQESQTDILSSGLCMGQLFQHISGGRKLETTGVCKSMWKDTVSITCSGGPIGLKIGLFMPCPDWTYLSAHNQR